MVDRTKCDKHSIAERYAEMHRNTLAYDRGWYSWNGSTWDSDGEDRAVAAAWTLLKKVSKEQIDFHQAGGDPGAGKRLLHNFVAKEIPEIARIIDLEGMGRSRAWDAKPDLLGTPGGVVDLRTGEHRPGKQDDHVTRRTAVEPGGECPRWERFLDEVFSGNDELIGWLQRAVGYTLTGETGERCFFLCIGNGANGKSTLFKHLRSVLDDYGDNIKLGDLLASGYAAGGASPHLMRFNGPRMLTASELPLRDGKAGAVDVGCIKDLTGDDVITGRPLYQAPVTFRPTAKLWLGVNHRPRVDDVTESFWDRARVIPFERRFTGDNVDATLDATLEAERGGILAWAVRGAVDYYKAAQSGLAIPQPPSGKAELDGWHLENDHVKRFIAECCRTGPGVNVPTTDLHNAACTWWNESVGPKPITRAKLTQELKRLGVEKARMTVGGGRTYVYAGIAIDDRPDAPF
jgi:putative DNA primase/helicase